MTPLSIAKYRIALPKCSIYRRYRLKVLRFETYVSILFELVFWFMLGACLYIIGAFTLNEILSTIYR